jgi:predicted nucleotidyltransferase
VGVRNRLVHAYFDIDPDRPRLTGRGVEKSPAHHMKDVLQGKDAQVTALCRKHRVRRLALFGSGAKGQFDPTTSDVDLLVEFEPMTPSEHADSYFGLIEDLERLLDAPVDLVENAPIKNPYFRQAVEATQVVLFEAA